MARKFKGLEKEQYYRGAMRWMSIGIEFAIVCAITSWLGAQLDKLEPKAKPGWMIMGFFVGFGIMFRIMLKRAKSSNKEIDEQNSKDDDQDK
jgi:F0F1-type ATP synthase assembly protein I